MSIHYKSQAFLPEKLVFAVVKITKVVLLLSTIETVPFKKKFALTVLMDQMGPFYALTMYKKYVSCLFILASQKQRTL